MKIPTPKEILLDIPSGALKKVIKPALDTTPMEAVGRARDVIREVLSGLNDMVVRPHRNLINAFGSDIISESVELFSKDKAKIVRKKVTGPLSDLIKKD